MSLKPPNHASSSAQNACVVTVSEISETDPQPVGGARSGVKEKAFWAKGRIFEADVGKQKTTHPTWSYSLVEDPWSWLPLFSFWSFWHLLFQKNNVSNWFTVGGRGIWEFT